MKKLSYVLIILVAGFFASSVKSQDLQLFDAVGNNVSGTDIYLWGDTANGNIIQFTLKVKNVSAATLNVKSKKIETSLIPGTIVKMCFAGQCYLSTVFTSTNTASILAAAYDTTFIGEYSPKGHLGESIVTFVFFNTANKSDTAFVIAHFDGTPAAIAESNIPKTKVSNPYPNPASNYTSFDYTFVQGTTSAKFVLNDILGSKVKQENIDNLSGTLVINTGDIEDGIYFYSFYENDRLVLTKKMIVKH